MSWVMPPNMNPLPQIGAQLYLSARTVEWHLRRVYPKLGISSRRELARVLEILSTMDLQS